MSKELRVQLVCHAIAAICCGLGSYGFFNAGKSALGVMFLLISVSNGWLCAVKLNNNKE